MMKKEGKLKEEFKNKLIFILDLDGTVYRGDKLIEGADEAIRDLIRNGKYVYYLTNNATRKPASFAEKLRKMNCPAEPDWVVSSGSIAAQMMAEDLGVKTLFVIGTEEIIDLYEEYGIKTLNRMYDPSVLYADFLSPKIRCDAVCISMDIELTYAKIRTAMELIARGAEFYATNTDKTFPQHGQIWPGSGMGVAALEACVGRPPKMVFGKPNRYGIDIIMRNFKRKHPDIKITEKDLLIIGDRLETDILQANLAGIDSVLVETGIHTAKDIERNENKKIKPTYILPSLKGLFI